MPQNEEPPTAQESSRASGHQPRLVTLLIAVMVVLLVVGILVWQRDDRSPPVTATLPRNDVATTTAPAVNPQREVVARLREILALRDRAIATRKADLLNEIYTVDCKCLEDGLALIRRLRREGIVWKGVKTSISISQTEEVNDRLWIVVGTVTTPSVRIETESGRLVRTVPPERNLVRFGLTRSTEQGEWLLGHASAFD